jgi:beta-mannosidase
MKLPRERRANRKGGTEDLPTSFASWSLGDFDPGEGLRSGAHKEAFDDEEWTEVSVPGDVHSALLACGRIEDPFYDRNEAKCAWVEDREWWYRLRFDGPEEPLRSDERLRLVFHGLDTLATIYLNGEELGRHENMFREAAFDVTGRLRAGEGNVLAIRFDPPLRRVEGAEVGEWASNGTARTAMRKAQFGYGWDWGPRLPTVGIWRPVELRSEEQAALLAPHFYTLELAPDRSRSLVAVRVEAERFAGGGELAARVRLTPPGGGGALERTVALAGGGVRLEGTAYLEVEDPKLWWTHDLGEPHLYGLEVTLLEGAEGLDRREQRVGIRTLGLDQSPDPDEPGTRFFRFVLNGVPVFARGANWIPAHSFVGSIEPERYERLVSVARDANMNMLRVWGGGIYEHDAFYDLCDALGILVWQDFMFACAAYPEAQEFASEVEAEARYQVRRLRSRPSLALWCGNNENQWIQDQRDWRHPERKVPGALYYDEVLPKAVAELDGKTPYWPGSPYGGDDHNDQRQGDTHDWNAWHGQFPRRFGEEPRRVVSPETVSYLRYAENLGRFNSEFGLHAPPPFETLRRAIPEDQLYHHSPSMDHHNKDNPKDKADDLMLTVTGLPKDLDEYLDFGMISQAEGLKFGVEHFRRRKPHCSGTLIWQLNDCWPALSWSLVDYHGFGKAGYWYVKRAYAPVLASFETLPDGSVELRVTNDTLTELKDEATIRLGAFSGETVWEEEVPVLVHANASRAVARWEAGRLPGGPDRYLSVRSAVGLFPKNRHFFAAIKDLKREPAEPEANIEQAGEHELRVSLRAPGTAYAYFVHLLVSDEATQFSDNYFDLEPGERRTVVVTNRERPLTPEMVRVRWR